MRFPIRAVAEGWGLDATLSIEVTVIDESSGNRDSVETWVRSRPVFPGGATSPASVSPGTSAAPPSDGRGPEGSVSLVRPQTGQTVAASGFPIQAWADNWGLQTYLLVSVEVRDVETGHTSFASCLCNTYPRFPGQAWEDTY